MRHKKISGDFGGGGGAWVADNGATRHHAERDVDCDHCAVCFASRAYEAGQRARRMKRPEEEGWGQRWWREQFGKKVVGWKALPPGE